MMKPVLFVLALIVLLGLLMFGCVKAEKNVSDRCEKLGGYYFETRDGDVCLRRDVVIPLDGAK